MKGHENNQSILIPPRLLRFKFLKFCYFLSAVMLFCCGNKSANKNEENNAEVETKELMNETNQTGQKKTILCFGDSITAGYGLDDTSDAFPGVLQQKIDSLGLDYTVVNSGVSGETSSGGLGRIQWVLNQDVDFFLLELGANDGLRGISLDQTKINLQSIIDKVKAKNPETIIVLAGMELPPNMGADYTEQFRNLFSELAKTNDLEFLPFILKDVGGIAELNQGDGIHPTEEGHRILAENVWQILEPLL